MEQSYEKQMSTIFVRAKHRSLDQSLVTKEIETEADSDKVVLLYKISFHGFFVEDRKPHLNKMEDFYLKTGVVLCECESCGLKSLENLTSTNQLNRKCSLCFGSVIERNLSPGEQPHQAVDQVRLYNLIL